MKTWTDTEILVLKENYNKVSNDELCKLLPLKTELAIYKKAYNLGMRKTKEISFLNRSNARKGEKSSNWNGGVRKTRKGYRQILMPHHKRSDSNGYVMEHIVVFEKESGITVPNGCCIHHLNGIKDDNRIENLCMMTRSSHTIFHHSGSKRSDETRKNISESKRKKNE